jgi:hypothetical protein
MDAEPTEVVTPADGDDTGSARTPIYGIPGPGPHSAPVITHPGRPLQSGKALVQSLAQAVAARDAKIRDVERQLRSVGTPNAETKPAAR